MSSLEVPPSITPVKNPLMLYVISCGQGERVIVEDQFTIEEVQFLCRLARHDVLAIAIPIALFPRTLEGIPFWYQRAGIGDFLGPYSFCGFDDNVSEGECQRLKAKYREEVIPSLVANPTLLKRLLESWGGGNRDTEWVEFLDDLNQAMKFCPTYKDGDVFQWAEGVSK